MSSSIQDPEFLERLIIKSMLDSTQYIALVSSVINPSWFDNSNASHLFMKLNEYFKTYKSIPSKDVLVNLLPNSQDAQEFLNSTLEIEASTSNSYEFIIDSTENWIRKSALKSAILDSADIINNNDDTNKIDVLIKEAMSKSIMFNLGCDYWNSLGDRLKRIFSEKKIFIPSYYPSLDEMISGGYPPKTLNLLIAKTHGFKSLNLINQASRQVKYGHNVIFFTHEMSEDMVNQRFDSIYTGLDVNRIYVDRKNELLKTLKEEKEKEHGLLIVKEFPPGFASANTLSAFLHEMEFRGITFESCFIDYLNLCRPIVNKKNENMYMNIKVVSEEIRALGWKWNFPIISASQFNRGGAKSDFDDVSSEDVSESYGTSMTSDFSIALGFDEDSAIYCNEISWKIIKNRHGGRVGHCDRFYYDPKSLRIYDGSELDLFFSDALISESGERETFTKKRK